MIGFKTYVLNSQRAAAYCVCFVLSLFVTYTKSKFINQVSANAKLVVRNVVTLHFLRISISDCFDACSQSTRALVFLLVVIAFYFAVCC